MWTVTWTDTPLTSVTGHLIVICYGRITCTPPHLRLSIAVGHHTVAVILVGLVGVGGPTVIEESAALSGGGGGFPVPGATQMMLATSCDAT
jgi:hypothetical protein